MARLLGAILIVEALIAIFSTLRSLPDLPGYDPIAIVLVLAAAAVGALQLTSGSMLFNRRPPGPALGQAALLLSAILTTLVVGFRLAPSDVFYWIRWEFVSGYWAYTLLGIWILRSRQSREI